MAKVLLGPMVAEARGQAGGTVFSRNRFGAYIRQNVSPVQPNTTKQQEQRSAFTQAAQRWRDTLTPAQREAWKEYALGTPMIDSFGLPQIMPGNVMYVRANTMRIRAAALSPIDDAPVTPGMAPQLIPTLTGDTTNGIELTAFTPTLLVADTIEILESDAASSQSRNFFNGPFTQWGTPSGSPALPLTLRANTLVAVGQRWWYHFRVFLADGKVGPPSVFSIDILA
jgi:hypothetical protein